MKNIKNTTAIIVLLLGAAVWAAAQTPEPTPYLPGVPYVPTKEKVVNAMLELAKVTDKDIVYDLGSGDGRIVIAAAKNHGAKGVGIDNDPKRIKEANANAKKAGVTEKVKFIEGDLFEEDFTEATVVTLYLLPAINMKLRPDLLKMKPGTRIVSHAFDMGDWEPDEMIVVEGSKIYLWTVPEPEEQ